jgi:hypothetical protein
VSQFARDRHPDCPGVMFRPFRALICLGDQPRALPWAIVSPPLWGSQHPHHPEQSAIAAYLDEETTKLDALVGKVEEAVERLREYRTALITAAVTVKIDVRNTPGTSMKETSDEN